MKQPNRNRGLCDRPPHSRFPDAVALVTLAIGLTVQTACSDSRIDVYEFIEMQRNIADDEAPASTTARNELASNRTIDSFHEAAIVAIDADADTENATPSNPARPFTPSGRWRFDKNTQMWKFIGDEPSKDSPQVATESKRTPDQAPTKTRAARLVAHDSTADREISRKSRIAKAIDVRNAAASPENAVPNQNHLREIYDEYHRPYRAGPSDVLRVTLIGLTGVETLAEPTEIRARINRQGFITLPLVGQVKVGDLEIEDIERAIQDAYVPKFVASLGLSVEMHEHVTTDVVVVGAALLPGIVKLNRCQRDVLHAVVLAGGMTQDASGTIILQRIRNPREKVELNVRNTNHLKTALALDPLEAGDVITVVAAQPNTIFVGGLVNAPGPKEFPPGTTINALQALAAGGGIIEAVLPTEATIIRRMSSGEDVFVRVDLEKTKRGEDPNVELAAGDIFWVPETAGTRIMDFLNRTLFLRAGMTVSYNVTGLEFMNRRGLQGTRGGGGGNNLQNSIDPLGFLVP
ncbi:MAG: polysaccharide biosynthesis/export family protein [Phycisphaerae bacterium]|nr:polysaccharide biosynthesis/export family protein [Phycisphaerae bacterium]